MKFTIEVEVENSNELLQKLVEANLKVISFSKSHHSVPTSELVMTAHGTQLKKPVNVLPVKTSKSQRAVDALVQLMIPGQPMQMNLIVKLVSENICPHRKDEAVRVYVNNVIRRAMGQQTVRKVEHGVYVRVK